MEEKIFFDTSGVSVSNSRFIVNGQTYAMSNVTSVKTGIEKAKKDLGVILIIIGLGCLFWTSYSALGALIVVFGIAAIMIAKDIYSVILSTAAGENQALSSKDKAHIEKVVTALNESIISRG